MMNNRPGFWKRPALHQRRDQLHQHSPLPQHPLSSREECPAKRRRDSTPDQVELDDLIQQTFHLFYFCAIAPPIGTILSTVVLHNICASLFSHPILDQGIYFYLPMLHHHLATTAPTKMTGSLFMTRQVLATTLPTGPQQHSNRLAQ